MSDLLPKQVYSKLIQGMRPLREDWEKDRLEDLNRPPYDVEHSLRRLIDRCITEGRMHVGGSRNRELLASKVIDYLLEKGLITKCPYGGYYFPLPEGTKLPTIEEYSATIRDSLHKLDF